MESIENKVFEIKKEKGCGCLFLILGLLMLPLLILCLTGLFYSNNWTIENLPKLLVVIIVLLFVVRFCFSYILSDEISFGE